MCHPCAGIPTESLVLQNAPENSMSTEYYYLLVSDKIFSDKITRSTVSELSDATRPPGHESKNQSLGVIGWKKVSSSTRIVDWRSRLVQENMLGIPTEKKRLK